MVKDIEGKVKEDMIKEDDMVMCFVLKGLGPYGKIQEKEKEKFLKDGNVPSIF